MRTTDQLSLSVILFRAAAPYGPLSERRKGGDKKKERKGFSDLLSSTETALDFSLITE